MSALTKISFLALASIAFSLNAQAQQFGISLSKHGKHGSIALQLSSGYCAPPPKICPPMVWKPGHCQTVYEKVWIAGGEKKVWVEPIYETIYDSCGHPHVVCVRPGCWKTICTSGHYETRPVQTCSQGYWQPAG